MAPSFRPFQPNPEQRVILNQFEQRERMKSVRRALFAVGDITLGAKLGELVPREKVERHAEVLAEAYNVIALYQALMLTPGMPWGRPGSPNILRQDRDLSAKKIWIFLDDKAETWAIIKR